MNDKMSMQTIAKTIFDAGPAEKILLLIFLAVFLICSSSGSTNAPIGTIKKSRPRDFTFIFPYLASMPWEISCTTIAIASARIPYPMGITGFIPGMPKMRRGEGALWGGILKAIIRFHIIIAVVKIIATMQIKIEIFP